MDSGDVTRTSADGEDRYFPLRKPFDTLQLFLDVFFCLGNGFFIIMVTVFEKHRFQRHHTERQADGMYELLIFKIGELSTSTADINRHGISVADRMSDRVISVIRLFFTGDDLEFHTDFRLDPLQYSVDVYRLPDGCCGNRIDV